MAHHGSDAQGRKICLTKRNPRVRISHKGDKDSRFFRTRARPPGMSDSISALTSQIQTFVDARDWRKYHNAKDLAVAISAEAGELMQHFVWQQEEQIENRLEEHRAEIASEIADVAILLFEFADNLGYNLGEVMQTKIARNEVRYPVEKSRGNNLKYSEL